MVYGIEKFKEAFAGYEENYVVIGGTACDAVLTGSTMQPRATADIDMIIVVEKLTPGFVDAFWKFIFEGGYKNGKRKCGEGKEPVYELYRFTEPKAGYPVQIELLARHSDVLGEPSGFHIEPLPTEEEQYSLSAIMLDDDNYHLTINNSIVVNGLRVASPLALIGLKERAFLNLTAERENGRRVNTKDINKHRNDVLRLGAIVDAGPFPCTEKIYNTHAEYLKRIHAMLPSQALRDAIGADDERIGFIMDTLDNLFEKP